MAEECASGTRRAAAPATAGAAAGRAEWEGLDLPGTRGEEGPQDLRAGGGSKVLAGRSEAGSGSGGAVRKTTRWPHAGRGSVGVRPWHGGGDRAAQGPRALQAEHDALLRDGPPGPRRAVGGRGNQGRRVRRRDLQALADELLGRGLSPATVSNVINPIQAFYRRAVDRDELAYNPSERIDLPNGHSKRRGRIASPAEAAALLAALDAEDRPVWATAFYAGLRRGELQALRARDIDLEANLIAVERGWGLSERA